ncbi:MAG: HAD-IB family hydrolase [Flavobacteriaceae bacterium]|nr:HAD-IB family hydrolase [Flavobacteriaceae bacterium]NNM10236.1 HAD-IB family hydrolase [Flavobacteriaceae bacterium]
MSKLFLYDFDGTISRKDTLFDFLRFTIRKDKLYFGYLVLTPIFVLTFLRLSKRSFAKERLISHFLKGKTRAELAQMSEKFLNNMLTEKKFRTSALASIKDDKKEGAVYIVSASLDIWLKDIANHLGVHLICTRAKFENNVFTGKFLGPNCNNEEKPRRVQSEISLEEYNSITYYGDSKGDLAMKEIVDHFEYRKFE